jgi:hypothetical protein
MSLAARPGFEGLTIAGRPVATDAFALGELRPADGDLANSLAEEGLIYLPGFLDRADVLATRASVLRQLEPDGLFEPGAPLDEGRLLPGADTTFRPDVANSNPAVKALLYSPRVMALFDSLFAEPAMHYDFTWLRAVGHGRSTLPHYDTVYMGRGSSRVLTMWVPLGDVPLELGGLAVLEGSNRATDLIETYGRMDVDEWCENKPGVRAVDDRGLVSFGALPDHPDELRRRYGSRWLTTEYRAGDVLVFGMHTLHASLDNRTHRIRLSTDSRYQPASEPADPRWIGDDPPGHGPGGAKNTVC